MSSDYFAHAWRIVASHCKEQRKASVVLCRQQFQFSVMHEVATRAHIISVLMQIQARLKPLVSN